MTIIPKFAQALAALAILSACNSSPTTPSGSGTMSVQLTDAPFSGDSVSRVDIFVVRVDARLSDADSAEAAQDVAGDSGAGGGWTTVATPNESVDLLAYQNGTTLQIGEADVPAGTYRGVRLVIDASRSSVTLKDGTVLTGTSSPNVTFPSAARTGIKVILTQALTIAADETTVVVVDFMVGNSFVQRGATIAQNGLLFKPVIHASIK